MTKPKKIKVKMNYLHGRTEFDSKYLTNGSFLFDVTEVFKQLPDEIQLAFQCWEKWQKLGKDMPYAEYEAPKSDSEKEEGVVDVDEETPFGPWERIMKSDNSPCEAVPLPFLYQKTGSAIRIFRYQVRGANRYAFINENFFSLACELAPVGELSFWCSDDEKTPILVRHHDQCIGRIAQVTGILEEMEKQGFELGYTKPRLAKAS